jgi:gliding motility-associated-like protein
VESIQPGDWSAGTTWSGGEMPLSTDTVWVRHKIILDTLWIVEGEGRVYIEPDAGVCGRHPVLVQAGGQVVSKGCVNTDSVKILGGILEIGGGRWLALKSLEALVLTGYMTRFSIRDGGVLRIRPRSFALPCEKGLAPVALSDTIACHGQCLPVTFVSPPDRLVECLSLESTSGQLTECLHTGYGAYCPTVPGTWVVRWVRETCWGRWEDTLVPRLVVLPGLIPDTLPRSYAVCPGVPVQLVSPTEGEAFWTPAEGLSCQACATPLASPTQSTTYTLFVGRANSCRQTTTVRVEVLHTALSLPTDTLLCVGQPLALSLPDSPEYHYRWSTGDTTPTVLLQEPGLYGVEVETPCGVWNQSVRFSWNLQPERLDIPNVLTPNGDGVNDGFRLELPPLAQGDLEVFDRWGQRVHRARGQTIEWWPGPGSVQAGVYFYRFTWQGCALAGQTRTGSLTLLAGH